jgi:hypothetical protein
MKKLFVQFSVQKSAIYWKGYSFSPVRKAINGSLQRICLYDYLGMPGGKGFRTCPMRGHSFSI